MPHYFFDINDVADDQGRLLGSFDEAQVVARQLLAADLARTSVEMGCYKSWSCLVRDGEDKKAVRVILALLVEDMNRSADSSLLFRPT